LDERAQLELRSYAETIGQEIVSRWCPIAWDSFCEYRLAAISLSRSELEILRNLNSGDSRTAAGLAGAVTSDAGASSSAMSKRERLELEAKLRMINVPIPWTTSD
jgi:thymidylate synthase (FAD)